MNNGWLAKFIVVVRSRNAWIYATAGVGLVLCLAVGMSYRYLSTALSAPYKGYPEAQKLILISTGMRTEAILAKLRAEGILEYEFPGLLYIGWNRSRGGLKAGEYSFERPLTGIEVLDKLIEGQVHHYSITFPEGLTLYEVAQLMESRGFGSRERILQVLNDVSAIKDIDPIAKSLEGYLFPDTYFYVRGTLPQELVRRMVGKFKEVFTPAWANQALKLGLGTPGAVTLASLIEKETVIDAERAVVSAVFHRRLAKRMLLQCDPTVIYASILAGKYDGVIHRSDLDLRSPYNTYQSPGLPPGPIANPGAKALHAALYPANVDFLYFVAKTDGTHYFSGTLTEHNKATRLYQR